MSKTVQYNRASEPAKSDAASAPITAESVAVHGRAGSRRTRLIAGAALLGPFFFAAVFPGLVSAFDPMANVAQALTAPSWAHPLGTDDLGRDLLARVVSGARTSLLIGIFVAAASMTIGVLVGLAAGALGGQIDNALMRFTEFIMILPRFLVALLVGALYGPSIFIICVVLGAMSWTGLARIVRAETMAQTGREYVLAARALGGSSAHIMIRHLLPAAVQPALAVAAPVATAAILAEAGLGFLGLSDPSVVSWGNLIRDGQEFYSHGWWLSVFPGLSVVLACLGAALLFERDV